MSLLFRLLALLFLMSNGLSVSIAQPKIEWEVRNIRFTADDTLRYILEAQLPPNYYLLAQTPKNKEAIVGSFHFAFVSNLSMARNQFRRISNQLPISFKEFDVINGRILYSGIIVANNIRQQKHIKLCMHYMYISPTKKLLNAQFNYWLENIKNDHKTITVSDGIQYQKFTFEAP